MTRQPGTHQFSTRVSGHAFDASWGHLTIVIPHRGRDTLLCRTLASIARQRNLPAALDVIVVTKNDALCVLPGATRIEHVSQNLSIAAQRNVGARLATGEYLAFIDADIDLHPDWARCMIDLLTAKTSRVLVSAVQQSGSAPGFVERVRVALSCRDGDSRVTNLGGANLLMRRRDFLRVGGFPEHLATCEDTVFTQRLAAVGDVYLSTCAPFVHLGEDRGAREYLFKEFWRGRSNYLSVAGRAVALREWPSLLVPLWVLLWLLISIAAIVLGSIGLLALSVLGWSLPIVLYAIRLSLFGSTAVSLSDGLLFYLIGFIARGGGGLWGLVISTLTPGARTSRRLSK